MSLIDKIFNATEAGHLYQPFTVSDLKNWMATMAIVKDDGKPYASSSIDAILSNSAIKNDPTTNKNRKILQCRTTENGKQEYWF